MLSVDKNKLKCALRFNGKDETNLYYGQCVKDQRCQDLYVKSIGSIPIPVSCQNVQNLIGAASSNHSNEKSVLLCQQSDDHIENSNKVGCSASSACPSLQIRLGSSCKRSILEQALLAVKKIIKVSTEENIKIRFDKLTFCTAGRQWHEKVFEDKKPGILFGKFILQIPVEGGYEGGKLMMGNTEHASFDFHIKSDRYFYAAAALSTNFKPEWLSIQQGNLVALQFDLIWQPETALTISSISFSDFVMAGQSVKEVLQSWDIIPIKIEETKETVNCTNPEDAKKENHFLIIPLTGSHYHQNNFNFPSLRGRDRHLVHILQSIDFVDLHLAVISQNLEESDIKPANIGLFKWDVKEDSVLPHNRSFKLSQWIYSSLSLPQFHQYDLDLKSQLVGDISTILQSESTRTEQTRHPVIVIQPRHQSIRRCCSFQFDAILDHLESRLSSDGDSIFLRRQSSACLDQILDYCQTEPMAVWDIPDDEAAERTRRLLKICQDLQAKKSGLHLIKLLGQDFSKVDGNGSPKTFYEGVRNETVAQSIVEMLFDVGGWNLFAETVFQLIAPTRLLKQLKGFAAIVIALLDHQCHEEANAVMQRIFSAISLNLNVASQFDQSQIDAYVDAVIALETHQDLVVMKFLVPVYSELTFYQQCRLLIDLQKDGFSRLKSSTTYLIFYEKMCLISLRRCLCQSVDALEIVNEVVACIINLGEKAILEMFIDRVLWCRDNTSTEMLHLVWLEELLDAAKSSPVAKKLIDESLKKKIEEMKLSTLVPSSNEEVWIAQWRLFFIFWYKVLTCFNDGLSDLRSVCGNIPGNFLLVIFNDYIEIAKSETYLKSELEHLLYELGTSFLDQLSSSSFLDESENVEKYVRAAVKILEFFAAATNNVLEIILRFAYRVILNKKCKSLVKNSRIGLILSSSSIWTRVAGVPEKATVFKNCLNDLLTIWVLGLLESVMEISHKQLLDNDPAIEEESKLRTDLKDFYLTFIRMEKQYQNCNGSILSGLVKAMSMRQLTELVWSLKEADLKEQTSLKNFPTTLGLFRDLCRQFISGTTSFFQSWISDWKTKPIESMFIETVQCFLWLGDDDCVTSLANTISAMDGKTSSQLFLKIIQSSDVRRLTDSFPLTRDSLSLLLATRVSILNEELREINTSDWMMPNASLSQHPNVEKFLHSPVRRMTYQNFSNKKQAKKFVSSLRSVCFSNGYEIRTLITGTHFNTKCIISKVKSVKCSSSTTAKDKVALLDEKVSLEKIVSSLKQRKLIDVSGSPASKKLKLSSC